MNLWLIRTSPLCKHSCQGLCKDLPLWPGLTSELPSALLPSPRGLRTCGPWPSRLTLDCNKNPSPQQLLAMVRYVTATRRDGHPRIFWPFLPKQGITLMLEWFIFSLSLSPASALVPIQIIFPFIDSGHRSSRSRGRLAQGGPGASLEAQKSDLHIRTAAAVY